MKILITQSNYIPWKGYFEAISNVDVFVVYDSVQYTKRDWRNRNRIKAESGLKWLSVPVETKGRYHQKISETKVSDNNWNKKHLSTLIHNYRKAGHFLEMRQWLEDLYLNCHHLLLSDINMYFLKVICDFLNIGTPIYRSGFVDPHKDKTQKLVDICVDHKATTYYTGPAAKNYLDEDLFKEKGIEIQYLEYKGYPEYNQLFPPFCHQVSIIDLILSLGSEAKFNYKGN